MVDKEFSGLRATWRWIGPSYRKDATGAYLDPAQPGDWPEGHGTGILSKINGTQFGASKKVKVVIVRSPEVRYKTDIIDATEWIIQDWRQIRDQEPVKVAIINMSWLAPVDGSTYKAKSDAKSKEYARWRDLLNEAAAERLLPICVSGNTGAVIGFLFIHVRATC